MKTKILISILGMTLVATAFQNCGQELTSIPGGGSDKYSESLGDPDPVQDPNPDILPSTCTFNGVGLTIGQTVQAYAVGSVPYGSSCTAVTRTCTSTGLTGSGDYASCSVGVAASCLHAGVTVLHGQTVVGYNASSVAYGESCNPVQVQCSNGTLSSTTAVHRSCTVAQPLYKWVQAGVGERHLTACARAGLFPSVDKGYGICASGELRPQSGTGYQSINYSYGAWGATLSGGTQIVAGYGSYYCYQPGQRQDMDNTDRLVAYLCSQVPNTVDTSPPSVLTPIFIPRDGP